VRHQHVTIRINITIRIDITILNTNIIPRRSVSNHAYLHGPYNLCVLLLYVLAYSGFMYLGLAVL